jgi:hypothetical protein
MIESVPRTDLIALTADKDAEYTLRGLLSRPGALGIRPITIDWIRSPEHDPGVLKQASALLRLYLRTHAYALVLMDREGCGKEDRSREQLETSIERDLSRNGWGDRARVIVLDPELEIWVWADSPDVDTVLGWQDRQPALRDWLVSKGMLEVGTIKPRRPKEAMQQALRTVSKPRSSDTFQKLASVVGLQSCSDPAFYKLRSTLQAWFPAEGK